MFIPDWQETFSDDKKEIVLSFELGMIEWTWANAIVHFLQEEDDRMREFSLLLTIYARTNYGSDAGEVVEFWAGEVDSPEFEKVRALGYHAAGGGFKNPGHSPTAYLSGALNGDYSLLDRFQKDENDDQGLRSLRYSKEGHVDPWVMCTNCGNEIPVPKYGKLVMTCDKCKQTFRV